MKKKSTWNRIDWLHAREIAKKPFLFIQRSINRYALTQDEKTPKYLTGKKKSS